MVEPLVSVIIPTKNSEATLSRCLQSIKNQTYKNVEVIIVDSYSTDKTIEIAKQFKSTIIMKPDTERSEARNYGAKIARGIYLYCLDSDSVSEPVIIQEAVEHCLASGFEVITVHNTSDPSMGLLSRIRKLERDCYADDDIHVAARFFSASAFWNVGGYNLYHIAGEDYDLHRRLKQARYSIGRITAKEVHLGEYKSWRELGTKHRFYGKTIKWFLKTNYKKDRWAIFPIRWIYVRHYRDFLKDAKLTIGFVLYTYIRFANATIGYLSSLGERD